MFTGIIEEIGTIRNVKSSSNAMILDIAANVVMQDVKLGDSIAVNGVCLTVTSFSEDRFSVDVMPETIKASSLNGIKSGSKVNLERAMQANGRFGGHIVSGHVDGIGKIVSKKRDANAVYYKISLAENLTSSLILKGSVTIDGTSLTIFDLTDSSLTVSIIPHTLSETVIGEKGVGDIVNIECDLIGKYIHKLLGQKQESDPKQPLSVEFLKSNGFA